MAVRHKQFPHIQGVQVRAAFLQPLSAVWPCCPGTRQCPHIQGLQLGLGTHAERR